MLFNKYFLGLLFLLSPLFFAHQVSYEKISGFSTNEVPDSTEATSIDTLHTYAQRANTLWEKQESDLELANRLLAEITKNEHQPYYKLGTRFYFWSIQNASFEEEKQAIKKEVERLSPLVSDSTKATWQTYLENEDPHLLREIIGFWRIHDPYSSTQLNERLIEHWHRINYAKSNLKKSDSPPYSTDERGLFYVRLGPPDKYLNIEINISQTFDPVTGQKINFDKDLNKEIEIWEYRDSEKEYFFLFGYKNESQEYGLLDLRDEVLELVDPYSIQVRIGNGRWLSPSNAEETIKSILQYTLYKELAPYHSYFQNIHFEIRSRLFDSDFNQFFNNRFSRSIFSVRGKIFSKYETNLATTPISKTSLKSESMNFPVRTQTFQFLNKENDIEYIFAIQPNLQGDSLSAKSLFLNNQLFVFDNEWNRLSKIDDLKKVSEDSFDNSHTYQIGQSAIKNNVYFSSEIIDTSRNDILLPNRVNPQTSAIVKSTGRKRISFSNSLDTDKPLLISDIVIARQQKQAPNARIPISPSLDMKFKENEDIMIYFEAYNIPEGGYSFTYYFKRKRWLGKPKKLEDKSEVTILAEKAEKRDSQLFSINLDDLDPQAYQLVIMFSPLDNNSNIATKTKQIDFEIVE